MSDALLEDLHDLHQAIEQVFWAIACDDPDAITQAQHDTLALIEALALLHCDIRGKIRRDEQRLYKQMGLQEVLVPNHEGWYYVVKSQNSCN